MITKKRKNSRVSDVFAALMAHVGETNWGTWKVHTHKLAWAHTQREKHNWTIWCVCCFYFHHFISAALSGWSISVTWLRWSMTSIPDSVHRDKGERKLLLTNSMVMWHLALILRSAESSEPVLLISKALRAAADWPHLCSQVWTSALRCRRVSISSPCKPASSLKIPSSFPEMVLLSQRRSLM